MDTHQTEIALKPKWLRTGVVIISSTTITITTNTIPITITPYSVNMLFRFRMVFDTPPAPLYSANPFVAISIHF